MINKLYWAAGFLEGEGYFCGGDIAKDGARRTARINACQVQEWPIHELQKLFGGTIMGYQPKSVNAQPVLRWDAVGKRAAAIMMTLYPLMSPKRQESIKKALISWKAQGLRGSYNRNKTHCKYGHEYTADNTFIKKFDGGRECIACRMKFGRRSRKTANRSNL